VYLVDVIEQTIVAVMSPCWWCHAVSTGCQRCCTSVCNQIPAFISAQKLLLMRTAVISNSTEQAHNMVSFLF